MPGRRARARPSIRSSLDRSSVAAPRPRPTRRPGMKPARTRPVVRILRRARWPRRRSPRAARARTRASSLRPRDRRIEHREERPQRRSVGRASLERDEEDVTEPLAARLLVLEGLHHEIPVGYQLAELEAEGDLQPIASL